MWEVVTVDINELNESLKMFLVDTRAERYRLSEKEKATRKVADYAYKLQRAVDKLIELDQQEQGGE